MQKRLNIAQVPLLPLIPALPVSQQMPLEQLALQHSLEKKQESPFGLHAGAHLPLLLSQLPLAHWWLWLHLAPAGLGLAQAMPGMEASVPPTRAAPINLSALRREMLPLASALVSSSK